MFFFLWLPKERLRYLPFFFHPHAKATLDPPTAEIKWCANHILEVVLKTLGFLLLLFWWDFNDDISRCSYMYLVRVMQL